MKEYFFLSECRFYDSAPTKVERSILEFARPFEENVMDIGGIRELAKAIRTHQDIIISSNKRLRSVDVEVGQPTEWGCRVRAGKLYISFQKVRGFFVSEAIEIEAFKEVW